MRLIAIFLLASSLSAQCSNYNQLRAYNLPDIGVHFETKDKRFIKATKQGLKYWSTVINLRWHEDNTSNCALTITADEIPGDEKADILALASIPWDSDFDGSIQFNSALQISASDWKDTAIHEIGHILGLEHNPNPHSFMAPAETIGKPRLTAMDMIMLAGCHHLRGKQHGVLAILNGSR